VSRVDNFSAGPAALPESVLRRVRDELLDWKSLGMSVMEVSHRGKSFIDTAEKAESDFRQLLAIPDDYSVLFVQGGATMQFSMVPFNLSSAGDSADYVQTGSWSKRAIGEAQRFCNVNIAADAEPGNFTSIPPQDDWHLSDDAAYVHITPNETIAGVEFHFVPDVGDKPLVGDMSSTLLSRPIDVSRYGVIYAGAQKNIGPAGITVVIVRKDLLDRQRPGTPHLLTYEAYASSGSMTNTPPTFAWYVAGLVFEHLIEQGGLQKVAEINAHKAATLYAAIDNSGFFSNPVSADCRSWMNVPFVLADPSLDKKFLDESTAAGLTNLKGHRSVGGMRASIYNAVPVEAVEALVSFMQDFERKNG
jgi:phosphoserine aminotransferase